MLCEISSGVLSTVGPMKFIFCAPGFCLQAEWGSFELRSIWIENSSENLFWVLTILIYSAGDYESANKMLMLPIAWSDKKPYTLCPSVFIPAAAGFTISMSLLLFS